MNCWNNRLLKNSLSPLRTKQRYQSQIYDYYLRESKNRKKTMEEILDLNKSIVD